MSFDSFSGPPQETSTQVEDWMEQVRANVAGKDDDATVSGDWTFSGSTSGIDHGNLDGLGDDDHPQYGALAQNETVTGAWTFDATMRLGDGSGEEWFLIRSSSGAEGGIEWTRSTDESTVDARISMLANEDLIFDLPSGLSGRGFEWRYSGNRIMRLHGDGSLIIGTDPGGSRLLRVGGEAIFDSGGADGDEGVFRFTGRNGSARLDVVADENNSGETNLPTLRLDQDGSAVAWELSGQSDNAVRLASQDSPSTSDALEIARGGRMVRLDGGSGPSSGGIENIVHHGTGSPSSVGVTGTLHTVDA